MWEQITVHEGWKVLSDKVMITERILTRNGTHLSMSGDSPFARGSISDSIGLDGKGTGVDEMLQGTFITDKEGLNEVSDSSEMQIFIKELQIPLSDTTGNRVSTMDKDMTFQDLLGTPSMGNGCTHIWRG